jgi:hypothetical protein
MASSHKMTLGGHPMRVNPNEMRWNFGMKVADQAAVGGKVIQILGVKMSDLTLTGQFTPDWSKGDKEAWQQAERFRQWVKVEARKYASDATTPPLRLTYPPRGWDFNVYIKSLSPYENSIPGLADLRWQLVLFPVGEGANKVVKGVKDLYIQRMMDGIGWKQSDYNGPMTQALVDETLGGSSVQDYVAGQMGDAFAGTGATDGGF